MAAPVLVLIGGQNSRPTYISPGMAAARMLADRLGAAYTVELHPRNGDRGGSGGQRLRIAPKMLVSPICRR